ncbi:MAG: hypothetical protein CMJ34_11120 [Phycisphaerae bacterium]|nr:hypothetical protein [Phycisphaerae bacterium]
MKTSISTTLAAILLITPIGAIATAQDSTTDPAGTAEVLPTPQQVVDRMVEFNGGDKAIKDAKPVMTTGTFSVPQAQMTGKMTTWSAPPNLMRVDIQIPGLGTTMSGFNGTVGWTLDPTRGPSLMEGDMLDEIRREADPTSILNLLEDFKESKVVGRVTFEGVECLQLQLKQGKTVKDMFVEEKTGRLVGVKAVMPTPMGELPTTSVIEKWITIGPRKVPSRTVIKMMGMEQVMQIDKVVTDSFNPDVFDLPPAIKALADAKQAAKKASDGDASSSGSKDSSSSSGGGR